MTHIQKHDCKIELRQADLKATPARLAVLSLLENADKPVDVATIIDYLKANAIKADPVTAFRIINLFTERGLTKQIHLNEGKFRYELTSRAGHHHLICENCRKIEDIQCSVDEIDREIKEKKQFIVKHHSLEFYGTCKNCQG
jgi:Fur family transcriptional regulator, ferric uptake regulator